MDMRKIQKSWIIRLLLTSFWSNSCHYFTSASSPLWHVCCVSFVNIEHIMLICQDILHIYTLSNFQIMRDVIAYLRRVTIKAPVVCGITANHSSFRVTRSEARNLPHVTSRQISKLDRVYVKKYHVNKGLNNHKNEDRDVVSN